MADEIVNTDEQLEPVSFGTRAGVFGASMATVGIADLAAHLGGYGLVGGTFFAILLTAKSPHLVALRKKLLPELPEGLLKVARRFNNRLPDEQEQDYQTTPEPEPHNAVTEVFEPKTEPIFNDETSIIGENPRRLIYLAPNFQPDANAVLSTGVAAFGIPGSGKTTTIVRFFEEYTTRYNLPFVAFDSQGDFKSLVESGFCQNGVIATPDNLPTMDEVIDERMQLVIDLDEWREDGKAAMSFELAGKMIAQTITELMAVQKAIRPGQRGPCLLALDETHLWVPQTAPSYLSRETAHELLDAVMSVATTGRKLGVVPFLATQRISKVNKDAIGGVETRIFGKCDLDVDIKRYREYITDGLVSDTQIRSFGKGEMIVCMSGKKILVQFENRQTKHISNTPTITQTLKKHTFAPAHQERSARPVNRLVITREVRTDRQTSHRLVEPVTKPEPTITRQELNGAARTSKATLTPELAQALELYQNGITTSRPMGRALGVTHVIANEYINRLKLLGEIV